MNPAPRETAGAFQSAFSKEDGEKISYEPETAWALYSPDCAIDAVIAVLKFLYVPPIFRMVNAVRKKATETARTVITILLQIFSLLRYILLEF